MMLPGSKVDLNMARRAGIQRVLLPGEKLVCDKGYVGWEFAITPIKGHWAGLHQWEKDWNRAINSVRVDVERVINVIKTWDALRIPWRHDITMHPHVFNVCSNLANIKMRFEPIRDYVNTWLL
jgi:hypothetical protein